MAPFPPRPSRTPRRRPPALAALLGWWVPGLGQLFLGRPLKALLFFTAIVPTFLVGWALTDMTAVDPQRYRLDFAGQVFLGLPTFAALVVGAEQVLESMPRFFEVGRLYVLVAGLLNLVAVCDAVGDAIARDREVLARRLAHRGRETVAREEVPQEAEGQEAAQQGAVDPSAQDDRPRSEPTLTGWED